MRLAALLLVLAGVVPAQEDTVAYNKIVREMEADYRACARLARHERRQAFVAHGRRSAAAWEKFLKEYPHSKHAFSAKLNLAQALQMAKEAERARRVVDEAVAEAKDYFQIKRAAEVASLVYVSKKAGWKVISAQLNRVTAPELKASLHLELIKYVEVPRELRGGRRRVKAARDAYIKEHYLAVAKQVAETYPETEAGRHAAVMVQGLQLAPGKPVPNLKDYADLEGKPLDLTAYRGKVLLLHFWTSRRSTRRYMPKLIRLYEQLKAKGLAVLAVNADYREDRDRMEKMIEELGIPFRIYHDGEKLHNKLCEIFFVRRFPYNILVDRDGKVLSLGEDTRDLLESLPERLGGP